jgi:nucleotide-binding universal stress UspA family protein
MYKHLFVPIDGSALSKRAMEGSIELAQQLQASITGFVVEPEADLMALAQLPASAITADLAAHEQRNANHSQTLLNVFAERAKAAGVHFVGQTATSNQIDHSITTAAEEAGCDMIVMMTHGRGALGEFVFGSHTKRVISTSKLPVLVLH